MLGGARESSSRPSLSGRLSRPENLGGSADSQRHAKIAAFHERVLALRRKLRITETTWLFLLAALSGVLAGGGSIVFHYLIAFFQWIAFGSADHAGPLDAIMAPGFARWRVIVAPAAGGLIVGALIYRFAREARGHGVPAVVRAVHERGGRISPIIALIKTIASALTLGSGGSLGREGPVVQIGASIGSGVGQLLGVTPRQLKMLAAGGAAAGLAAIFNSPLGGAFFALEVIVGSFAMEAFGPVVVASVAATVVSRAVLGNHAVILVARYHLEHTYELVVYVALGIACGAGAMLFTRAIALGSSVFERVPLPEWSKASLGGLGVGLVAWLFTPRILGNGYETVDALMSGRPLEVSLLLLIALKFVATSVMLGSGGSGGVFGPTLFLGAVFGSLVGRIAGSAIPVAPAPAYALVGMAAFVAGATHAPVSMVLMLFEMSDDYNIVLPLLIATSVASVVARRLYSESVDTVLDAQQGRKIHKNLEEMTLHGVQVSEAARWSADTVVRQATNLMELLQRFLTARSDLLAVVADDGRYLGVISIEGLRDQSDLEEAKDVIIARDLMRSDLPVLAPEDPLTRAIDAFNGVGVDALPVVRRSDRRFLGWLGEGDIVSAYRQALLRTELVSTVVVAHPALSSPSRISFADETVTNEIEVPRWVVGRSLAAIDLRKRHQVLVLAVVTPDGLAHAPDPHRNLVPGERLVVIGSREAVDALKRDEQPAPVTAV
jgi:CIC family chloride channel protein